MWNSLPDNVASSDSLNRFKNRLDKCLLGWEVYYNWEADRTGIEDRRPKS